MDSISSLTAFVKSLPISTPTPPSLESNITKQEQRDMTNTHTFDIPPPPFINSINELRSLSTALSTFLCHYDDLNNHLNSIKSSINHLVYTANPNKSTLISARETSCSHSIAVVPDPIVSEQNPNRSHDNARKPDKRNLIKKPEETNSSKKHEEIDTSNSKKPEEIDKSEQNDSSKKPKEIETSKKNAVSGLESICKSMSGKSMKRYVSTHISDMNKIREELPKALKLAKDPAKLVLASIGRFFVQRSRLVVNGSQPFVARQASVLILECFVMISSDGIEITTEDKESAAKAAADWKKRMISEGELSTANEVDARGLLLLVCGFGIPNHVFENKDIRDLIQASNVKGISTALRRSIILIRKIPELIDWMVKVDMEVEAADLAYTLGLEDKCHPQTILMKFFHNKIKDRQHSSIDQIKHQLSELKSLSKCLESHNIDPSKLFPEFKINEKIQQLNKKTHEIDLMATQKRKPEPKVQEPKRSRLNTPHQQSSPYPTIENGGMLTGVYGGPLVDHMSNGGPYVRHDDDTALMYRYLGQPYFSQPSLGQPYSSHPSSSGLIGLYGGPSDRASIESFPRLPDPVRRGPVSDLYGFADKVVDAHYSGSHAAGSGRTHYSN